MARVNFKESTRVLLSQQQIAARVAELGGRITRAYSGKPLTVVCTLKGSFIFAADLVRQVDLPLRVEFLGLRSYGDATKSSGVVQITQDLSRPLVNEHVLIIEDIVDTGLTSDFLVRHLQARGPESVALCSLLHKPARSQVPVHIDYLGFTIEDVFVVGYGLDAIQQFRNLPDICLYEGADGD